VYLTFPYLIKRIWKAKNLLIFIPQCGIYVNSILFTSIDCGRKRDEQNRFPFFPPEVAKDPEADGRTSGDFSKGGSELRTGMAESPRTYRAPNPILTNDAKRWS
jgi:hypothetical protein